MRRAESGVRSLAERAAGLAWEIGAVWGRFVMSSCGFALKMRGVWGGFARTCARVARGAGLR